MAWQEPEVIWRSDRSYKDKGEEVRLERGEYNGKPTYKLRILWKTPDGEWRWSKARETQSGNVWQEFGLKAKELRELGSLLLAEAAQEQPALDCDLPMAGGRGEMADHGERGPARREAEKPGNAPPPDINFDDLPF